LPVCLAGTSHAGTWTASTEETVTTQGNMVDPGTTGFNTTEWNGGRAEVNISHVDTTAIWAKAWSTPAPLPAFSTSSSGSIRVSKKTTYTHYNWIGVEYPTQPGEHPNIYSSLSWGFHGGCASSGTNFFESSFEPWLFHQNGSGTNFALISGTFVEARARYTGDGCGSNVPPEDAMDAQLSYQGGDVGQVKASSPSGSNSPWAPAGASTSVLLNGQFIVVPQDGTGVFLALMNGLIMQMQTAVLVNLIILLEPRRFINK
jgi:hypothetical protein